MSENKVINFAALHVPRETSVGPPENAPGKEARWTFPVEGMTCASCVARVKKSLSRVEGVSRASVNLATNTATVMADPEKTRMASLVSTIRDSGYEVPVDGTVEEGESSVDESMMTGEPIPKDKGRGDAVTGGTMNVNGRLVLHATHVGKDTALARIVRMVQEAQGSKPPIGRLADVIASYFVPSVMGVAAGVLFPHFRVLLSPVLAAAAMGMSSVTVVSNALRLRLFRP